MHTPTQRRARALHDAEPKIDRDATRRFFGGDDTPIDTATLYRGIAKGRYPAPVRVGDNISRWLVSECEEAQARMIAEHNPICVGIKALLEANGRWQGGPVELLEAIRPYCERLKPPLPADASWFRRKDLPKAIPLLAKVYGISVNGKNGGIVIDWIEDDFGAHQADQQPQEQAAS